MAGNFTITLNERDYQALQRKFTQAAKIDKSHTIKSALDEGISYIKNAGASNLASRNKVVSGNLKRSISKRVKKTAAYAGFKRATAGKKGGGNHAHLIDRGTDKRYTKKPYTDRLGRSYPAGMYRGSVSRGNPNVGTSFWTDAVETEGPRAERTLMDGVYETISKIMNNRK